MKTQILLVLVLPIFLLAIFAGGALAKNKSSNYDASVALPVDGGSQTPVANFAPTPPLYEGSKVSCDQINPQVQVYEVAQWGSTRYDIQKNGSMGRMIAIGPGGYKHMVYHEVSTAAGVPCSPYNGTTCPRWVDYNCEDPSDLWLGSTKIDGGANINAGYANVAVMHNGVELPIFHRSYAGGCTWYSVLKRGDRPEDICTGYFSNIWDLPDLIEGTPTGQNGMWPKHTVVYDATMDTDYIHIVVTQNVAAAGDDISLGYERCVFQGDNLICRSRLATGPVSYTVVPNVQGSPTLNKIGVFDTVKCIVAVPVHSPVSKKVAIVYTKHRSDTQYNNDVYYIESTNNGDDWLDGTHWGPPLVKHNITQYPTGGTERAYTDVSACYDYNDSLHIAWNGCYYDSVAGEPGYAANLYHWSKATGKVMIAPGQWENTQPGAWNRNISKMSISALDPIYHPGGNPDSVYLFVTWTQFNPGDTSASGMGNGDIYGAVSNDGGLAWTPGYNLTNTQTPGCLLGNCLSEHWSSMAENMYGGDEHIEYVCDREAGDIIQTDRPWTDNPMIYIHVAQLPFETHCGITYTIVDPPSWTDPPIKVPPNGSRSITLQVQGIYNLGGNYLVTSDNPKVTITSNQSGFLSPNQTKTMGGLITCSGEGYIDAIITIHECIGEGAPDEKTDSIRLVAICDDSTYYECKRAANTYDVTSTDVCSLWVCSNTMQIVWDKRVLDDQGEPLRTIYSAGAFVATTSYPSGTDSVVGRQEDNFTRALPMNYLRKTTGVDPFEPTCLIKKIHVEDTYIWYLPPMIPHTDPKWRWISIYKQIIMFMDNGAQVCPLWKKCQVIKYYWIKFNRPPLYWPNPGPYSGHGDIYFGVYADPDCPADTGRGSANTAGFDSTRMMLWQRGHYNGAHPEYDDYYVGLALTDTLGTVVDPYAAKDVRNDTFIYPQSGWRDDQLFGLADTAGVWIQDPDSVVDRSMVLTFNKILAGTDTTFQSEFVLIEALIKGNTGQGLTQLQRHIDTTRIVLIPELRSIGLFKKRYPICGDVTGNGIVDAGDLVWLLNYLFVHGPAPVWPSELTGDVTGNGVTDAGDLVYLLNYLFVHGPAPHCPGM
jgi:hypothetical protein